MGIENFIHNNGHENRNRTLFILGKVIELSLGYLPKLEHPTFRSGITDSAI